MKNPAGNKNLVTWCHFIRNDMNSLKPDNLANLFDSTVGDCRPLGSEMNYARNARRVMNSIQ